MQSSINVFKLEGDTFVECVHSILPPENGLILATGGILDIDEEPVAVVCGGELVIDNANGNQPNDRCLILNEDHLPDSVTGSYQVQSGGGSLNMPRIGAASLVIDNGNTLWITAGTNDNEYTEFATITRIDHEIDELSTNGLGPKMPNEESLSLHCLVSLGQDVAILIGGRTSSFQTLPLAWSISVSTIDWTAQASLSIGRHSHACGVLQADNKVGSKLVIAAGGENFEDILSSVETLLVNDNDTIMARNWEVGPTLPIPLSDAATASHKSALYIIGGTTYLDNSGLVFRLHCFNLDEAISCSWAKIEYEIKMPTTMGLALMIPSLPMTFKGFNNARDCDKGNYIGSLPTKYNIGHIYLDLDDDESILLVTTGGNLQMALGNTEMFVMPSYNATFQSLTKCQAVQDQAQSMYAVDKATGGLLLRNASHIPIVCGGTSYNVANQNCYKLERQSLPTAVGVLSRMRLGAASAVILNGTTLWVTGGASFSDLPSATTEWINVSMTSGSNDGPPGPPGPPLLMQGLALPKPRAYHCLEIIEDDSAVLYGGGDAETWTISGLGQVVIEDADNVNAWTVQAQMAVGRSGHGCGVIRHEIIEFHARRLVIAAGGIDSSSDSITNRVEFLVVTYDNNNQSICEEWREGPSMPIGLTGTGSSTTEDQTMLYIAGGKTATDPDLLSRSIFKIALSNCTSCHEQEDGCVCNETGQSHCKGKQK